MEKFEIVLATYIDVSLLLGGAALVWFFARKLMSRFVIGGSYSVQFTLLKLIIFSIFVLPVFLTLSTHTFNASQILPFTLSDLVLSQYLHGNIQVSPSLLEDILSLRQNLTSQIANPNSSLVYALILGALATASLMLARSVLTAFKLRRILRCAHPWRKFGNLNLLLSDTVHVPFSTRTFKRRYIVLPSTLLSRNTDTKVALAHEIQHLRQSDVDWEFGIAMVTPLFFWNPAFHYLRRQLEELRELSCDQKVLKRGLLGSEEYCACLLRVCADRFHRPKLFQLRVPEVALVEIKQGIIGNRPAKLLANRLLAATNRSSADLPTWKVILVAFLMLTTVGTLSFSIQKPHDWSQDRLMLSTIINLERLENRNKIGLGSYRSY